MPGHSHRVLAGLLLATVLGVPAAADDTGDMNKAATEKQEARRDTRRGPALADAIGMIYTLTTGEARRVGASPLRPVPGMDVVGPFEGSMQSR